MTKTLAPLCLALTLVVPLAARADEASDKLAAAKVLVERTVLKTLDTGFSASLEKTVAPMPEDRGEKFRKEARAEFDKERQTMLEGLSKTYAEKFSLQDLQHIQGIYEDKVYQKFQTLNSDPKSEINIISQASVTRLLNMLSLAAAGFQKDGVTGPGGIPGQKQMQMPAQGK